MQMLFIQAFVKNPKLKQESSPALSLPGLLSVSPSFSLLLRYLHLLLPPNHAAISLPSARS